MSSTFNARIAVEKAVEAVKALSSSVDCAVACVSGGVDSTVATIIARLALGERLYPVFIDTGFMRKGEAQRVRDSLKDFFDIEVYDYSEEFISSIEGLSDAEEKRIAFREKFYSTVKEIAREKNCSWVVQGTIKADVVETLGRIKTQHNVLPRELLERYGLKVIEPLVDFYKHEVRAIARYLGVPESIISRQPFPGPGLLIRAVGKLTREKLELVRRLTSLVEEKLEGYGFSQYFPAAWEYTVVNKGFTSGVEYEVLGVKTTGVYEGTRTYGYPVLAKSYSGDVYELYKLFNPREHPHVLVELARRDSGAYLVAIRAVETVDYVKASVPRVSIEELRVLAEEILEKESSVRVVAFDITPKPPATIEYE